MYKSNLLIKKHLVLALVLMLCRPFVFNSAAQIDTLFKYKGDERLCNFWTVAEVHLFKETSEPGFVNRTFDTVSQTAKKYGDEKLYWYAQLFKILYTGKKAGLNTTIRYPQVDAWIAKCPFDVVKGAYKHELGYLMCQDKKMAEGLALMLQAQDVFEKTGFKNIPEAFHYLYELSVVYYSLGDYPRCFKYARLSENYRPINPRESISNPNTEGLASEETGDFKKAGEFFLTCLKRAEYYNDSDWVAIASGNYGRALFSQGDYKNAAGYLLTNYSINLKEEPENAMYAVIDLAGCYAKAGNTALAKFYAAEGVRLRGTITTISLETYYKSIYRYYETIGNIPLAFIYADSLIKISDSVNAAHSANMLKSAQARLETENQLSQLTLQQESEKKWLAVKNVVIVSIAIVLFAIVLLIYNRYRIVDKDKMIVLQQKHIADIEKLSIQEKLLHADDQLNAYIKSIAEKNSLIEKISGELAEPGEAQSDEDNKQHKVAALLELSILTEEDWKKFKQLFDEVYPHFFIVLKENCPTFTNAEMRLLALMKLNIPNKEISYMIGVSAETIIKTRYRIKKKLVETDIHKELEQFVGEL